MATSDDHLSTPGAGPSRGETPSKRAKTGCITCRVRKKRCDERKPFCASCERLGIECLGYSSKRPGWLRGDDNRKKVRADLKQQIMSQKNGRGRDDSTDHDQDSEGMFDGVRIQSRSETADNGFRSGAGSGSGTFGYGGGESLVTASTDSSGFTTTRIDHTGPGLVVNDGRYTLVDMNTIHTDTSNDRNGALATGQTSNLWSLADVSTSWGMQTGNMDMGTIQDPQRSLVAASTNPNQNQTQNQAQGQGQGQGQVIDNDTAFEDVWRALFGDKSGFTPSPTPPPPPAQIQPFNEPDPTTDLTLLSVFSPSQFGATENRHVSYLHHYLNVVLPLQYRLGSRQLTDLIGPLAMTRNNVFDSAASLAALHLVAQRTQKPLVLPTSWNDGPDIIVDSSDSDMVVARSTHRQSLERLRFLSSDDLTSEDVIVSALFAISFHLFSGGTSREWKEVMATSQRCLSAALNGSPEITGTAQLYNFDTPWQRYKPLIAVMVWMDILGSVSQNKATQLLPTYRLLLDQRPVKSTRPQLSMANVMGCDNTTMLALAETVQLSEWKEMAEATGCLSIKEMLHRAAAIERLLGERSWREGLLSARLDHNAPPDPGAGNEEETQENLDMIRVMREVFFAAAKLFLATVINGPHPRVPEVASAVQDVTGALHQLDLTQSNDLEINRALVLPITLAGCHCETTSQQAFFRGRFQRLGNDAAAFGNSRQALQLMEEVWRQRAAAGPGVKVCWRKAMKDLGWDVGILLI